MSGHADNSGWYKADRGGSDSAGGGKMLERELTTALQIAEEQERGGTPKTPKTTERIEDPKRDETIDAIATTVRGEIEFAFASNDTKAMATGVSFDRFLRDGTTLVARNWADTAMASQRGYVLDNRRITEIGGAVEVAEERDGNAQESQNPLDVYMKGLRALLERVLKEVETSAFGNYEIKVVATDSATVEQSQRNRVEIHDGLGHFTHREAASEGTR